MARAVECEATANVSGDEPAKPAQRKPAKKAQRQGGSNLRRSACRSLIAWLKPRRATW